MVFTQDGLDPIIDAGRSQYEIAMVDSSCKRRAQANEILSKVAASTQGDNLVWADKAARLLPGYDGNVWRERLSAAAAHFGSDTQTSSYRIYIEGMLQLEAGEPEAAKATLHKVFLLPDQTLSYHLTRLAIKQSEPAQVQVSTPRRTDP
jgi:hypothetical protein